jgi:hypothetical protein
LARKYRVAKVAIPMPAAGRALAASDGSSPALVGGAAFQAAPKATAAADVSLESALADSDPKADDWRISLLVRFAQIAVVAQGPGQRIKSTPSGPYTSSGNVGIEPKSRRSAEMRAHLLTPRCGGARTLPRTLARPSTMRIIKYRSPSPARSTSSPSRSRRQC